jgi:DNA adenine methylase
VQRTVESWSCDSDSFYKIRALAPEDATTLAAQFIYLNRLCFNGLYRVNRNGGFNVPYGRPRFERVFTREHELVAASKRLEGAKLVTEDFALATISAKRGDFVYLDPPYVAGHRNNGFIDYNSRVFQWEDQRRLAELCTELSARGVFILVSNADHPSIRGLYDGAFHLESVSRFSSMSAKSGSRGLSQELLISNYRPHDGDRP